MQRRFPNPRLAKSHRCYEVAQIAELYACHRNTVRNWLKQGLKPLDERRPLLVHGSALNLFQATRRAKAKRRCGPGEIFCIACHKPQQPAGGAVDYRPMTALTGTVTAICPDCERIISQRVNAARLATFETSDMIVIEAKR